jgi:hypothetical protein
VSEPLPPLPLRHPAREFCARHFLRMNGPMFALAATGVLPQGEAQVELRRELELIERDLGGRLQLGRVALFKDDPLVLGWLLRWIRKNSPELSTRVLTPTTRVI